MLEKHGVKIQHVTTKYKHTHTAFIEALNKIRTERLFKVQEVQELNDPDKVSATSVKHLYGLVDELNDMQTGMTGMKPSDAIKLNEVPLVNREVYPEEDTLPEDGLYRYLLQPGEEHNDQWCRAMDRIWSKKTHRLREIVEDSGNRVMYYLSDGPERAFVLEELMLIPEGGTDRLESNPATIKSVNCDFLILEYSRSSSLLAIDLKVFKFNLSIFI